MADAYVIEVQGNTVGIIVREQQNDGEFRFLSSLRAFNSLEGQVFSGPFQAESAARTLLKETPRALTHKIFVKL